MIIGVSMINEWLTLYCIGACPCSVFIMKLRIKSCYTFINWALNPYCIFITYPKTPHLSLIMWLNNTVIKPCSTTLITIQLNCRAYAPMQPNSERSCMQLIRNSCKVFRVLKNWQKHPAFLECNRKALKDLKQLFLWIWQYVWIASYSSLFYYISAYITWNSSMQETNFVRFKLSQCKSELCSKISFYYFILFVHFCVLCL